jgi:hypothetical protein
MSRTLFALCLYTGSLPALVQDPPPRAAELDDAAAQRRFAALPVDRQELIVRTVQRRLQRDPDPLVQAVMVLDYGFADLPAAPALRIHDPARWAKGVAPERQRIAAGTAAHRAVVEQYPPVPFLDGLRKAAWYDWGEGRVVRRPTPLAPAEVFDNCLDGWLPGADLAVARLLAKLDQDPQMRKLATYFEHWYADLDARVYDGVTIYQAWYSSDELDVPDVDAIPFAIQILNSTAYRSPIPAGPARTRLYGKIRDAAFAYRKYRTLREAAAGALLCAEPAIAPTYTALVPRFHVLFATLDHDPDQVAAFLGKIPDREQFLIAVDAKVVQSNTAWELREQRKQELTALRESLRQLAHAALEFYTK